MSSRHKARIYADRLRQLGRLGLSTLFESGPPRNTPADLTVEQCGPDIENPIVDLRDGRTLYVVWLSLLAEKPGLRLYDFRFEPPWPDRNFEMLPGFTESCIGEAYVLPNQL